MSTMSVAQQIFFFFNDTATTEIYTTTDTLSLHDALPISAPRTFCFCLTAVPSAPAPTRSEEHTSELQSPVVISYAVFCLKKKKKKILTTYPIINLDVLTNNTLDIYN